ESFKTQLLRVMPNTAAQRLWDRILSPTDREALGGDLATAYRDGRTVGMWARLRGCTSERAVAELAHRLGFINVDTQNWLLREFGEVPPPAAEPLDRPVWDVERRELRFQGTVIRRVRRPNKARNVVGVLTAFEEAGWPPQMDDPL